MLLAAVQQCDVLVTLWDVPSRVDAQNGGPHVPPTRQIREQPIRTHGRAKPLMKEWATRAGHRCEYPDRQQLAGQARQRSSPSGPNDGARARLA
jgi:hypothetical protein